MEIIAEFDTWRKVRDADGSEGWGVATCGPDIEIREGAVVPANAMIYKSEEV